MTFGFSRDNMRHNHNEKLLNEVEYHLAEKLWRSRRVLSAEEDNAL